MRGAAALFDQLHFIRGHTAVLRRGIGNEIAPEADPDEANQCNHDKRYAPPEGDCHQADNRAGDCTAERLPREGEADHPAGFITRKPIGNGPVGCRIHRPFPEAE